MSSNVRLICVSYIQTFTRICVCVCSLCCQFLMFFSCLPFVCTLCGMIIHIINKSRLIFFHSKFRHSRCFISGCLTIRSLSFYPIANASPSTYIATAPPHWLECICYSVLFAHVCVSVSGFLLIYVLPYNVEGARATVYTALHKHCPSILWRWLLLWLQERKRQFTACTGRSSEIIPILAVKPIE